MAQSIERDSRARNKHKPMPLLHPEQRISSPRVLNEDGSVPKTAEEFLVRGFLKLRDLHNERPRRRDDDVRIISDGSSKSSTTYVCSPIQKPNRVEIPESQDDRPSMSSSSADMSNTGSAEQIRTHMRDSLERHEAKIRAMQAEIAALKRAAILTNELRLENALEQAKRSRTKDYATRGDSRRVQRQPTTTEPCVSGGNGKGKEKDAPTSQSHPNTSPESMNGMPTPPQLIPFELRDTAQSRHSRAERKANRKFSQTKLCLCPKCISTTQDFVNAVAAHYSAQDEQQKSELINSCHENNEQVPGAPRKPKRTSDGPEINRNVSSTSENQGNRTQHSNSISNTHSHPQKLENECNNITNRREINERCVWDSKLGRVIWTR